VNADEAGRPAANAEGMLAALVFAVVSLLLAATLRCDRGGTVPESGGGAAASRSAGRP